jgi:hypothetical protein
MYFFDLNDYRGACFFGPAASYVGDPEDDVGTYRATRDAYLKALNESIMGFFQLPNLECATCLDCRNKFSAAHCELITFENSIEVITATLLFFNMYKDWGLDPNTILYPDPDKKFGVQNYTYNEVVYSGSNCTGTISTIQQTIPIDYGDGLWNQNIMNEYLRLQRKRFCLLDKYLKIATMNPQKSTLTNFVQIQ